MKEYGVNSHFNEAITHYPVMKDDILEILKDKCANQSPHKYFNMLDCTIGTGGHALHFLKNLGNLKISGLDSDERMIEYLEKTVSQQSDESIKPRIEYRCGNFKDIPRNLSTFKFADYNKKEEIQYDFVFADLGYNSIQLENPDYGLKYSDNGNLDMRYSMDNTLTAKQMLNELDLNRLEGIFRDYGQENRATEIAKAIVERRKKKPFETNKDLLELLDSFKSKTKSPKTPKRIFQSLRIAVNSELSSLDSLLSSLPSILKPNGFAFFLVFHSLEKEKVQNAVLIPNIKVIHFSKPSAKECQENSRSKSASLVVFRKKKGIFE